jgi:hypothetical protein
LVNGVFAPVEPVGCVFHRDGPCLVTIIAHGRRGAVPGRGLGWSARRSVRRSFHLRALAGRLFLRRRGRSGRGSRLRFLSFGRSQGSAGRCVRNFRAGGLSEPAAAGLLRPA